MKRDHRAWHACRTSALFAIFLQGSSEIVDGVCPKWFDKTPGAPCTVDDTGYICVSANLESAPPHRDVTWKCLGEKLQLRQSEMKEIQYTEHTTDSTRLRAKIELSIDSEERWSELLELLHQADASSLKAKSGLHIDEKDPDIDVTTERKELQFGDMHDLYGGIEKLVGPRTEDDVTAAVKAEHTERVDSDELFTSSNYKIETCSRTEVSRPAAASATSCSSSETVRVATRDLDTFGCSRLSLRACAQYWFVHEEGCNSRDWPKEACDAMQKEPHKMRKHTRPSSFEKEVELRNEELKRIPFSEKLTLPEVLCARLYTGPLFDKYNAVLRSKKVGRAVSTSERQRKRIAKSSTRDYGCAHARTCACVSNLLLPLIRSRPFLKRKMALTFDIGKFFAICADTSQLYPSKFALISHLDQSKSRVLLICRH
eukprot:3730414-Pleurochrysis_carterae.AAC.2